MALANLANLFNPQMVVLGGPLHRASDLLLPAVVRRVEGHAPGLVDKEVKITASARGAEACAMGAAALVLNHIAGEPAWV
jgi:predicted NBD/HSP70 family sugar kinase